MSDDDLANALESDLGRALHAESPAFVDDVSRTIEPEPEPEPEPEREPEVVSEPAPEPSIPVAEQPTQAEPVAQSEPPEPVFIEPPVRRSIPTAELASALAERAESGDDPDEIMTQLEEQLLLREQDAAEFRRWQDSMVADGGTEARAEVESVLKSFDDIVEGTVSAAPGDTNAGDNAASATHTFRVDEVLDIDLSKAPAPMTAPVADIPPPPGHLPAAESISHVPPPPVNPTPLAFPDGAVPPPTPQEEPPEAHDFDPEPPRDAQPPVVAPPPIPDLVEPAVSPVMPDTFDIEALIGAETTPDAEVHDAFPVTSEGVVIQPDTAIPTLAPPESAPPPNAPPPSGSVPAAGPTLVSPRAFKVEESSVEPTLSEQRIGRASRLFWLWFAVNSSVISVVFGGIILSLGMSLRQAIIATLIGVVVSALPLGLGTLAGKWSGQPTMIVSRATFGHFGNILPAVLAIVVRVFWGAVLLWFLAAGTARILAGAELTGVLSESQVMIIGLAAGFLIALVIAFFGYGLIARMHMVFTIISALLVAGFIVITWPAVDFSATLTVADGPWILILTGAVLVFSFIGLVWSVSSADLARYQRAAGSRSSSMLWSTLGAAIPAFVLIAYGAILAASNPEVASGLLETPLDTISLLIPIWYPIPLIAALALSLLAGVVLSIYSGGFALQATGATMGRTAAVVIVGAAVAAVTGVLAFAVSDFTLMLRDVATSLAVPIAAWAGIFGAEMMIRRTPFVSPALVKRGGVYANFRWVNLLMLLVASTIGLGLTTASVSWLNWQGYLFEPLGISLTSDLAATDAGVFVALLLGLLTPFIAGIPGIRRQEGKTVRQPKAARN